MFFSDVLANFQVEGKTLLGGTGIINMREEDFFSYFKTEYRSTSSFFSGVILLLADALAIFLAIGTSFFIINAINPSFINFRSFINYSVYLPFIIAVFYAAGLYPGIMISPAEEIKRLTILVFFSFMGIAISIVVEDMEEKLAILAAFVLAVPITIFFLPTVREIARRFFGKLGWYGVPAVIYCTGESGNAIISRMKQRADLGLKAAVIINSLATGAYMYGDVPVFPPTEKIHKTIKKLNIKVAVLCNFQNDITSIAASYRYIVSVPKTQNLFSGSIQIKDFAGILGFATTHHLKRRLNLFLKRSVELIFLLLLSPFALPIMAVTAIAVKISSPGPIFFGHVRIGKNGKKIKCWKFRSMYIDANEQLQKILATDEKRRTEWEKDRKFTDDPRVTKVGKFIRKTSLDELPQFCNVLLGQMSFVGPRPVTESELEKYGESVELILSVTPGISGMWQVSGRSDTGYEERVTLDRFYIQNWSVWLDLWIVIKTVWVVFSGKGAC